MMQKTVSYVGAGSFLKLLNEFLKVLLIIQTKTKWVKYYVTVKTVVVVPAFGVFKKKNAVLKRTVFWPLLCSFTSRPPCSQICCCG